MATRTCILLLIVIGLASASQVIMPAVETPKDSIFASQAARIKQTLERLNLVDSMTHVKISYGDMVRLSATGFHDLGKALSAMTAQAKKDMPQKLQNEINYLKQAAASAGVTVSKRSVHFPMDLGDQKLVFLVSDIIVPDGQ